MTKNDTATITKISGAKAYRKRRQEGTIWEAPSGAEVRVRELDISDHAVLNTFPDALQKMIYASIEKSAALRTEDDDDDEGVNPFAGLSGEEVVQREYEIGTTLCKLGWLEPQVVDEVTDEETQIGVDEVESADRRAYMTRVMGGYSAEAQKLAPFPEQPAGGVGAGSAVPAVQPAAVPADAAGDSGVLACDVV